MSKYTEIKEYCREGLDCIANSRDFEEANRLLHLIDIIERQRWAIIDLLINIELAHPEEYDQNRELPSVDKALKLTEE